MKEALQLQTKKRCCFKLFRCNFGVLALLALLAKSGANAWEFSQAITKGDDGIDGLLYAEHLQVSQDDQFVYVSGRDNVKTFTKDSQGILTCIQVIELASVYVWFGPAIGMAMTQDQTQLLVLGRYNLAVFDRQGNGSLYLRTLLNKGGDGIVTSSDNQNVYLFTSHDVITLNRHTTTGNLTEGNTLEHTSRRIWRNFVDSSIGTITPDAKQVLVAVSLDRHVGYSYLTPTFSNRVIIYNRSNTTGALQYQNTIARDVSFYGYIRDIKVSLDNKQVIVSGYGQEDSPLAIFNRNSATGAVTLNKYISKSDVGVGSEGYFSYPFNIALAQGNTKFYVLWDGVRVFGRSPATGAVWYDSLSTDRLSAENRLTNQLNGIGLNQNDLNIYLVGCLLPGCPMNYRMSSNALEVINYFPSNATYDFGQIYKQAPEKIGGLNDPSSLDFSPDARQLYLAVREDDALKVFNILPTGELKCLQVLKNGQGNVRGMYSPNGVLATQDNKQVFITGGVSLVAFDHDIQSGLLSFNAIYSRWSWLGAPYVSVPGLGEATSVDVTEDDSQVLVTSGDSLISFNRHINNGTLTFKQKFSGFNPNGIDGLYRPTKVKASPDGKSVFVTARDAFLNFNRSPDTGSLSFNSVLKVPSKGIAGASDVEIRRNGQQVLLAGGSQHYATRGYRAGSNGTLTLFNRNLNNGDLSCGGSFRTGYSKKNQIPRMIAMTPDEKQVFITGGDHLTLYRQSPDRNILEFERVYKNGQAGLNATLYGLNALNEIETVKVSPGGNLLAVVSWALVLFRRPSCLNELPFLSPFLESGDIPAFSGYLSNGSDYSHTNLHFRFFFDNAQQRCMLEASIDGGLTIPVSHTHLTMAHKDFAIGRLEFDWPEWVNYPRHFMVLLHSKLNCDLEGDCQLELGLSGRAYSIEVDDTTNLKAEDYFLFQNDSERLQRTFGQFDTDVTQTIYSCRQIAAQLQESLLAGSVAYKTFPNFITRQSIEGMTLLDVQCLRDMQGGFQLFANAEVPIQVSASETGASQGFPLIGSYCFQRGGGGRQQAQSGLFPQSPSTSPDQAECDIKVMLTTYYQPGDEQLTWHGLEVSINETEDSGNSTTPALVPTTSIILEQALLP